MLILWLIGWVDQVMSCRSAKIEAIHQQAAEAQPALTDAEVAAITLAVLAHARTLPRQTPALPPAPAEPAAVPRGANPWVPTGRWRSGWNGGR
jgi:hypothetical protein